MHFFCVFASKHFIFDLLYFLWSKKKKGGQHIYKAMNMTLTEHSLDVYLPGTCFKLRLSIHLQEMFSESHIHCIIHKPQISVLIALYSISRFTFFSVGP